MVSSEFGHLSREEEAWYVVPRHLPYYLFIFMLDGRSWHNIDLKQYEADCNDLIFVMPYQLHDQPVMEQGSNFIKLGLDENTLSLLPKQYPFLINPLNHQKVCFEPSAAVRVKAILAMLLDLLKHRHTQPELILAHLNSLLTEINTAYFGAQKSPADGQLATFIAFKEFVEHNLMDHLSITGIARHLGVNTNRLYQTVKLHSGHSPKQFIKHRLILEARRRICYRESTSVKELAYELGFNDPEYFSRLFRKVTGQTISQFSKNLSGN